MADKKILKIAIEKLQTRNHSLLEKFSKTEKEEDKKDLNKQIIKNNSLILDYQYRLEYE